MKPHIQITVRCDNKDYVLRLDNPYYDDEGMIKRRFVNSLTVGHDAADLLKPYNDISGATIYLRPSLISAVRFG